MLLEIMILLLNRHSPEEVFLSGTTPSDDDDHSASSFPMKAETQVSEWSVCDDQSSLEALLNAEQARREQSIRSLPSSFSGSYSMTSTNRLITEGHVVTSLVYQPNTVVGGVCDYG